MSLVRVHNFSISLDGFGTGEGQSRDAHFGHAGDRLHEWMFATRWWARKRLAAAAASMTPSRGCSSPGGRELRRDDLLIIAPLGKRWRRGVVDLASLGTSNAR
jgi:hypothetical protein